MKSLRYVVRCHSESKQATTFEEALRIAQLWRETKDQAVDVFGPHDCLVASLAPAAGFSILGTE